MISGHYCEIAMLVECSESRARMQMGIRKNGRSEQTHGHFSLSVELGGRFYLLEVNKLLNDPYLHLRISL